MSDPNKAPDPATEASRWPVVARAGRIVENLLGVGLAFLLLRSAVAHLGNPYYFLSTVYSYQVTGIEIGKYVASVLPFLQMTVAGCLLLRRWVKQAYLLGFLTFALFIGVQASTLRRGLEISCGCFGASDSHAR